MAYEEQLTELKNLLPTVKNILIALPVNADIDKMAAGLALHLSLAKIGKEASIVSETTIRVAQSHLFAIDRIQNTLPQVGHGGDLTIKLEGVAAADGTIPSLEKLDWYAENNNLNLVFHVVPGQTFQPTNIVPITSGSGFDLIFVIGAASLSDLGNLQIQNQAAFSGAHLVNMDNQQSNSSFGKINILDPNCSSASEIITNVINALGLPLNSDIASNLIAGVFMATNNLTNPQVNAETFMVVATLLRAGGKKPTNSTQAPNQGSDLSALMPKQPQEAFVNPQIVAVPPRSSVTIQSGSPEERPQGERVSSEGESEPDWLTPKIFKGTAG